MVPTSAFSLCSTTGVQRRWQLVFPGPGRAEPGSSLSQGPTNLQGLEQRLRKPNGYPGVPMKRVRIARMAVGGKEGVTGSQAGRDGSPT